MLDFNNAEQQTVPSKHTTIELPPDPVDAFLDKLADHGLHPESIRQDGKIDRFRVDGDAAGKESGWYVFFSGDICGGAFGDWRTGEGGNWCSKSKSDQTPEEQRAWARMRAEADHARREAETKNHLATAEKANRIFNAAPVMVGNDNPYLQKKGVQSHGLRVSNDGNLMVPMIDESRNLWNVETIPKDGGAKKGLYQGRRVGLFFEIPGQPGNDTLYICEGYSTGASIHEATGAGVVCSFNAGNLPNIVPIAKRLYPAHKIAIAGDDDQWPGADGKIKNSGRTKSTKAAQENGLSVVFPQFTPEQIKAWREQNGETIKGPTDFNDLAVLAGVRAVADQLTADKGSENEFQPKTISLDFDPEKIPARDWVVQNSLLRGHLSVLVGPGGVSKSTYTLLELILIAAKGARSTTDLIGQVMYRGNVLLINNEDDESEIKRRIAGIMIEYGITPKDLNERFFYESGYGAKRLVADETIDGAVVRTPFVDELVKYITDHNICVATIDPFVSTHRSNENDNSKIDDVTQVYKEISAKTGCTQRLVHHTRKGAGREGATIEDSRGGKALSDGCRVGEILLPLSKNEQDFYGLSDDEARSIVRMDSGKANYSKKGAGVYFQLKSVKLPNGDWVGVPRRIELEEKQKGKTDRSAEIATTMTQCVADKVGLNGGKIKWAEIRASYMNTSGVGKTTANDDVTLLPMGRKKAVKTSIPDGKSKLAFFYIWYEKDNKQTSPIFVSIEPQEQDTQNQNSGLFDDAKK